MSNIFKQFHDFQSRNVDHPSYEPLKQWILVWSPEEEKRKKRNEYHKEYYRKNKERIKAYNRDHGRKTHESLKSKDELSWLQKQVYDYLLNQYRRWEEPARWTQIAKALWISDNSVYTAVFQLTKKWYLGRGTYWKYLLLKFPDGENVKEEENKVEEIEEVVSKKPKKHVDGEDYSPWYVASLKHSIKIWQKITSELKERVVYLEEKLEKVQVEEVDEESKSDYLQKLEDKNNKLADEVIALRKIVKYLSKYID